MRYIRPEGIKFGEDITTFRENEVTVNCDANMTISELFATGAQKVLRCAEGLNRVCYYINNFTLTANGAECDQEQTVGDVFGHLNAVERMCDVGKLECRPKILNPNCDTPNLYKLEEIDLFIQNENGDVEYLKRFHVPRAFGHWWTESKHSLCIGDLKDCMMQSLTLDNDELAKIIKKGGFGMWHRGSPCMKFHKIRHYLGNPVADHMAKERDSQLSSRERSNVYFVEDVYYAQFLLTLKKNM